MCSKNVAEKNWLFTWKRMRLYHCPTSDIFAFGKHMERLKNIRN
jgi:hypothetical protein